MLRSVLSVIAGFAVASIVMMALELANATIFYPGFAEQAAALDRKAAEETRKDVPAGKQSTEVMMRRREVVREVLASAPVCALLVVVFGNALGSITGGFAAARLSKRSALLHGGVLGVMLTVAGIANNLMLPPPLWFWIASLAVSFPGACLGAKMVRRAA